ncbi:MAG: flagellar hook-length control protein FliK [Pirellulales bacterium]
MSPTADKIMPDLNLDALFRPSSNFVLTSTYAKPTTSSDSTGGFDRTFRDARAANEAKQPEPMLSDPPTAIEQPTPRDRQPAASTKSNDDDSQVTSSSPTDGDDSTDAPVAVPDVQSVGDKSEQLPNEDTEVVDELDLASSDEDVDPNLLATLAQPVIIKAQSLTKNSEDVAATAQGVVTLDADGKTVPKTAPSSPVEKRSSKLTRAADRVINKTTESAADEAAHSNQSTATATTEETTAIEADVSISTKSETDPRAAVVNNTTKEATAEKQAKKPTVNAERQHDSDAQSQDIPKPDPTQTQNAAEPLLIPAPVVSEKRSSKEMRTPSNNGDSETSTTTPTATVSQLATLDPTNAETSASIETVSTTKPIEAATSTTPADDATARNARQNPTTAPTTPQYASRVITGHRDTRETQRDGLNEVDRVRLVQRVSRAFQTIGSDGGEMKIRLSPPELGAVKLEVSLRDGTLIARMETETAAAKTVLLDNLPQLRERLAEQNVRIESFEVDVRDQQSPSDGREFNEKLREHRAQARNRIDGDSAPAVSAPVTRTARSLQDSSRLNIVI